MTNESKTRLLTFLGGIFCAGAIAFGLIRNPVDQSELQSIAGVKPSIDEASLKGSLLGEHLPTAKFGELEFHDLPATDGKFLATQKSPYQVRQVAAFENISWDSQPISNPAVNPTELNASSIHQAQQIDSKLAQTLPELTSLQKEIVPLKPHQPGQPNSADPFDGGKPPLWSETELTDSSEHYPLRQVATPIDGATIQLAPENNEVSENAQPPAILELDAPANSENRERSKTTVKSSLAPPTDGIGKNLPKPLLNIQPAIAKKNNDFRVARAPNSASPAKPPAKGKDKTPHALVGAENFKLAEQPKLGDHWKDDRPIVDQRAHLVTEGGHGFSPDPIDPYMPYDPYPQMQVYQGKTLNANQRPILELGRPWYQLGQLSPGYSWFGKHNNITPQFLVYGDVRTAVASNTQNGNSTSQIAVEANLDFDLKLTGTERFHMFMSPLDGGGKNTRWLLDDDKVVEEFDADIDFGYFEGDLGAIVGGFTNQTLPFDLPFAVGVMPLLLQNGVWMEDAFLGVAATIPARNSPKFNITNMDITFFAGYDKITSGAFPGDDSAARMYGMATFIEAMNGYFEIDYAFLDDRTFDDRSYHNIGIGFTRRYGRLVSNSTRVIINAGQDSSQVANTADGVLFLSENSLITSSPSTLIPYANFFAGFDRPQSAARAAASGGVLRNTGILFESDGMTDYPTLDATGNDTFGGALGLNILADDFSQQLVVEMAMLGVINEAANRNAPGPQYGVGFRYQLPLTNAIIFRADGMYGFLEDKEDVRGVRLELRHKY